MKTRKNNGNTEFPIFYHAWLPWWRVVLVLLFALTLLFSLYNLLIIRNRTGFIYLIISVIFYVWYKTARNPYAVLYEDRLVLNVQSGGESTQVFLSDIADAFFEEGRFFIKLVNDNKINVREKSGVMKSELTRMHRDLLKIINRSGKRYLETAEDIKGQAERLVKMSKEVLKVDGLDYSPDTVFMLDEIIDEFFTYKIGQDISDNVLAVLFGSYLGEVMTRNLGGAWGKDKDNWWYVVFNLKGGGTYIANPFGKVINRFKNGRDDLLGPFYEVVKREVSK